MAIVIVDAFEAWLKYKHRLTCLKRLAATRNMNKLSAVVSKTYIWLKSLLLNFVHLRLKNPTKVCIKNYCLFLVFINQM